MATLGELSERTFLSTSVQRDDAPRGLVDDTRVVISFDTASLSASAGCNTMSGPAAADASRLVLPDGLATTEIGCSPELAAQDEWLAGLLLAEPEYDLAGDLLTLSGAGSVVEMVGRRVAEPDVDLVGTPWTLDSIRSGETVSSVPGGVRSTLRFRPDGRLEVAPGCNTGFGTVEIGERTLVFGPIGLTMMACPGPRMEVEQAVTGVLQGEVAYEVEGQRLILDRGDSGLVYLAPVR